MRSKLSYFCILFLTSLLICIYLTLYYKIILFGTIFIVCSALFIVNKLPKTKDLRFLIHSLFVISLTFAYGIVIYFFSEYYIYLDGMENIAVRAEVISVSEYSYYTEMEIKIRELDGENIKFGPKALLSTYESGFEKGDIILFNANFYDMKSAPDNFTSYNYYKSKSIFLKCEQSFAADNENEDNDINESENNYINIIERNKDKDKKNIFDKLVGLIENLKEYIRNLFFTQIKSKDVLPSQANSFNPTEEAALVFGIFTGTKTYLSPKLKNNFSRTGISHILAVSGLHLSVLTNIMLLIMQKYKVHKKVAYVILILFCLFFIVFSGFTLSVIRAGIMLICFYSAFLLGLTSDSVTSLFFAGTLICLFAPYSFFNTGFQLSFSSTFGIIMLFPVFENITKKINFKFKPISKISEFIFSSFFTTLSAIIFTTPIMSYNFSVISCSAPIVNILISPFLNIIMFLIPVHILFSFIPFVKIFCVYVGEALNLFSRILINIANLFANMKYSVVSSSTVLFNMFFAFSLVTVIFFLIFFLFKAQIKNKAPKLRFILPSFIALSLVLQCLSVIVPKIYMSNFLQISYFTYTTNQYILIFADGKQSVDIIDISEGNTSPVYDLGKIIHEHGAVEINSIIFTHYHQKQPREVDRFLNTFPVKNIYLPVPQDDSDYEKEILNIFSTQNSISHRDDFNLYIFDEPIILQNKSPLSLVITKYEYNKRIRISVTINNGDRSYLYLNSGYENYDDEVMQNEKIRLNENGNDLILYGNHQHKRKDYFFNLDLQPNFYSALSILKFEENPNILNIESENNIILLNDREFVTFLIENKDKKNISYVHKRIN